MGVVKDPSPHYARSAQSMIDRYLVPRGIRDPRVLAAMGNVDRERFVPEALRDRAYADYPLPIGEDQTISQPYIVAMMTEALELMGEERVLEVGTGSGYQTAVLAQLSKSVFSVERHHRLATQARGLLEEAGIHNVSIKVGNGALGWQEYAPFDRIIVTAAALKIPEILLSQLKEGGKMVIPVGEPDRSQELVVVTRKNGKFERRFLCHCNFVPFVE